MAKGGIAWSTENEVRGRTATSTSSDLIGNALRKPIMTAEEVASIIPNGSRLMVGGFMGAGQPRAILSAITAARCRDLTVIATDCGRPGDELAGLIASGNVSRIVASFLGSNPDAQERVRSGRIEVEMVPQGTLVERIRSAGAGLGGVLTRTGLHTLAAEGKQVVTVGGEEWLLEEPLTADFALVACDVADSYGNVAYRLTAANLNPVMAMAGDTTVAESRRLVEPGEIPPGAVATPSVFVDYLTESGE